MAPVKGAGTIDALYVTPYALNYVHFTNGHVVSDFSIPTITTLNLVSDCMLL